MSQIRRFGLVVVMASLLASVSFAQTGRATRVVVSEGTVIPVRMDTPLSSARNRAGDRFTATVVSERDGNSEFPSGTKIEGVVSGVQRAGDGQPGALDLDFRIVRLPDGQSERIEGSLISLDDKNIKRTSDGSLVVNNRKDRTKFILYGAGAGLVLGALTKHTVEGVLLGAAAGYIYGQKQKDKEQSVSDVIVPAGTQFGMRLDRDVTYNGNRRVADDRRDGRINRNRSNGDIRVNLDGRDVFFSARQPIEERGNVLVPLAAVMDAANVRYEFNERRQSVRVNESDLYMKIGKPYALVDGEEEALETPAQIRDGEVYVPLRFLALATGMSVGWNADDRVVIMTSQRSVARR
jgi:hypothetical protein